MNIPAPEDNEPIGGAWLIKAFSLEIVGTLPVLSQIGSRRQTLKTPTGFRETHQVQARPQPTLKAHLTHHLKHEVPHLEMLARLFEKVSAADLVAWIEDEPTGQYARRTGFLFEWLTGKSLAIDSARIGGSYIEALDSEQLVVATATVQDKRWRVTDNMPGTPYFCPMIRRTPEVVVQMAFDCRSHILELEKEFGQAALVRSAVWLSIRESRASFQIEGEADKMDRISRFADVIDRRTGTGPLPLDTVSLASLQREILGPSHSIERFGIRSSPVFIGQVLHYREVVHYVAPPASDIERMLQGLNVFLKRTEGLSPIMRASVASFGFVYIHPMADGNGRVHRFLINDILRRDGAVPSPFIVPVSGLIARNADEKKAYDQILDNVSRPFMQRYSGACKFEKDLTFYEDGVRSNFSFSPDLNPEPAWRFMDLTSHVQYLGDVVRRTIEQEMRQEACYLRSHEQARAAIKELVEIPDIQLDRLIRSVQDGHGFKPSNAILKLLPVLAREGLWEDVCAAVREAFLPMQSVDAQAPDELARPSASRPR